MSRRGISSQAIGAKDRQETVTQGAERFTPPREANHHVDTKMTPEFFKHFDDTQLKRLRHRLKLIRYTEEAVAKRLQIRHVSAIALTQYPVYQARLRHPLDALSITISLFLMQDEMPRKAADKALTSAVTDDLLAIGLLMPASAETVVAGASIYPCAGFYFVTDHRFWPVSHQYYTPPDQPVMYLGEDSYALAFLAPGVPEGGRVLDLCTGSGVQAVMAARRSRCVVGVDINPRAVEFAGFNAALNGVARRCDFRRGSLYEPVTTDDRGQGGELFDVILANPPFVPSPHTGQDRLLYLDGGPAGDEILGGVLGGLLSHLTPGGVAAVVSFFVEQKRLPLETKIKRGLGSRSRADVLLFRFFSATPEEFASWYTWRAFGDDYAAYSQRYREWLDALRSAQIERLVNGVLAIRASQNAASSFRVIDAPLPISPQGDIIEREFSRSGASPLSQDDA